MSFTSQLIACSKCDRQFTPSSLGVHKKWCIDTIENIKFREKFKKKLSNHMKKNNPMINLEYRRKISQTKQGWTPWNKGVTGYPTSWKGQKHKKKTKDCMKKNHWSKKYPEKFRQFIETQRPNNPTLFEKIFEIKMIENDIPYITQFPVGNYRCDFYLPFSNLIIEIDGYEKEKTRKDFIKKCGYDLIHIPNKHVKNIKINELLKGDLYLH